MVSPLVTRFHSPAGRLNAFRGAQQSIGVPQGAGHFAMMDYVIPAGQVAADASQAPAATAAPATAPVNTGTEIVRVEEVVTVTPVAAPPAATTLERIKALPGKAVETWNGLGTPAKIGVGAGGVALLTAAGIGVAMAVKSKPAKVKPAAKPAKKNPRRR